MQIDGVGLKSAFSVFVLLNRVGNFNYMENRKKIRDTFGKMNKNIGKSAGV